MTFENEFQDDISAEVQISLYAIVGTVSFICNSLIFLVIGTHRALRTKSNLMLLSLATTDWLIIVSGIPVHLINLTYGENKTVGPLCNLFGFLILVPFLVSNLNMTLIAVHRYVMVVKNKSYRKIFSDRNTYIAIAFVWVIGIILSIPPYVGWGHFSYNPDRAHCMVDWSESLSYLIFLQVMAYPAPMATMCFCYYKILRHSYESSKRLRSNGDKKRMEKKKREVRLSIMLLLVLLCFFTLFFPYAILIVYEGIAKKHPSHAFSFAAMLLAYSNSMVDFWIYAAMSTKFRGALIQMFRRLAGKLDISSMQDSSSGVDSCPSRIPRSIPKVPSKTNTALSQNTEISSNAFLPSITTDENLNEELH